MQLAEATKEQRKQLESYYANKQPFTSILPGGSLVVDSEVSACLNDLSFSYLESSLSPIIYVYVFPPMCTSSWPLPATVSYEFR